MKIVLIIPTKDRPEDIQNLFSSLLSQTRKPDHVIIVDGSDHPIEGVLKKYSSVLPLLYLQCHPPSLPKQRNLGIANIPGDADWVGFLDDDLVLEMEALANLEKTIKEYKNEKLKGVGLCILNQPGPKVQRLLRFFLMSDRMPGKMTKAGFPTAIPCVSQDIKTDWLYGGATFWSKDIFEKFKFDEWFFGTGYMEDVDFSYRISRQYDLLVSSTARCNHYHHQIPVSKEMNIGEWQITSWWYFVKKHQDFSVSAVVRGMLGLVLKSFLALFYYRTTPYLKRFIGHLKGVGKIISGEALLQKGFVK